MTLKMQAAWSFEMMGTTHPVTVSCPRRRGIEQHHWENLRSCKDKVAGDLLAAWYATFIWLVVNDNQQDATILAYLFIPNQLYMVQAMSSPIIRSTWLYLQHLILSTSMAAGWCLGWDGTHLFHDLSQQQYQWTISDAVITVKCSWWWAKTPPETCRAD